MKRTTTKPDAEYIKRRLSAAVDEIFTEQRNKMGLPSDGESMAKLVEFDGTLTILAQDIAGSLVSETKLQTLSSVSVRHSEIFYTGGNIWCGVCQLPDGTWFSGEVNSWGSFYTSEEEAYGCYGDDSPDFIRFSTDEDVRLLRKLWKDMIKVEQTNIHGLACYCEEWLEELKEATFD